MTITPGSLAALFGAMLVLAAIPGVSAIVVASRSAALGFRHGVATATGIVAGDIVFIVVAAFGLSAMAGLGPMLETILRCIAGAYLIVLGIALFRVRSDNPEAESDTSGTSLRASVLLGLAITLGDQKAVLFYLGFLPAFVDLRSVTALDVFVIASAALVALLSTKIVYAWLGDRARALGGSPWQRWSSRLAGGVVIGVGVFLLLRIF